MAKKKPTPRKTRKSDRKAAEAKRQADAKAEADRKAAEAKRQADAKAEADRKAAEAKRHRVPAIVWWILGIVLVCAVLWGITSLIKRANPAPEATVTPTATATPTCPAGEVPQDGGGCTSPVNPTATPFWPATTTPVVIQPTLPAPADPSGNVDVGNPPFATIVQQDENGRNVTTLAGFDLGEFGGNDSGCTRTGDPEYVHIGEVVGSQSEKCLSVIEWSLKVGDQTILAGTYALRPGEWFYIPLAVFGQNDSPRIVGTLYLLPKGWNAHMFAADIAADRDTRDGTRSFVGLSPIDPWVVGIAESLK